jgi:hypothetical protein
MRTSAANVIMTISVGVSKDMKFKILGLIALILVLAAVIFLSFDRIILFTLSKLYALDISYKSKTRDFHSGYAFEDLKIFNKRMDIGFFSSRATLKPVWKSDFLKSLDLDFKFRDVHFLKSTAYRKENTYDTLETLVAIPFEGRWTYKDMSGTVEMFSNGLTLKRFAANGREIRLFLSGDLYYNNTLDMELTIYFSNHVLRDIPPELSSLIMKDEPEEWKSFSVGLKGDYRSPAVQISGKLFRLNIGTAAVKN